MPWQQYVADVVMEIDPDTGLLWYDEWGLTVPRQSGKSTLVLAKATHRCSATRYFGPRQRIVYTAQTRAKAREKFEEDFAAELESSREFRSRVSPKWMNGNEHIRFTNGSKFGIEATTEKAGHGSTLDEAFIDEAFAQEDSRLEQAFGPAMITRRNKQLGVISTAGWLNASKYLHSKIRRGRKIVLDPASHVAYFEWSPPDDADPGDPRTWWMCMPALGITITERAIRSEWEKARDEGKVNEFKRAYTNLWVPKDAETDESPAKRLRAVWSDAQDVDSQVRNPVAMSLDVAPDSSSAAIAIWGRRGDGLGHGEVVDHGRGTSWLVRRAYEIARRHKACVLVLDPAGPAGSFEKDLIEIGFRLDPSAGQFRLHLLNAREYAQACGGLVDDFENDRAKHIDQDQPPLNAAVAGVETRPLADAFKWSRKDSRVDICPLIAVTNARFGFMTYGTTPAPKPWVLSA